MRQLPVRIDTERLLMRRVQSGDDTVLYDMAVASFETLAPWVAWVHPTPTLAGMAAFCQQADIAHGHGEVATFLLIDAANSVPAGVIELRMTDRLMPSFELGYWNDSRRAGHGYMTEAVKALTACAFASLQARRVWLSTDERNVRSWRVAERAGFELEGTLRNERLDVQGQLRTTRIYVRCR